MAVDRREELVMVAGVRIIGPADGETLREYTYVLEGRVGARLGDEEVAAQAGELLFKPRGQWHTFWNGGDEPARMLEIISPGGFEQAFRDIAAIEGEPSPDAIAEIAGRYGVEADFEATMPLVEKHGLSF